MLFSSISFLYYFLPIVLLVYFVAPMRLKNGVLLLSSLIFYGWGESNYIFVMMISIVIGYVSGFMIEIFRNTRWKNVCFVGSVTLCLGLLFYFKYTDFVLQNIAVFTGTSILSMHVVLPIGISFYTFQVISYIVDVYRGEVAPQKNLITLSTYVSMFPQLIAGPIVRYMDIAAELESRCHTIDMFALGIRRFVIGLSKKILLADVLGELCEVFCVSNEKAVFFYWLYAAASALQIYFDFSGYSDMAIGLGKIFGFTFMENFDYPYISKSITEFWRRWHISLGSWFRDYIYIPLGGSRGSKIRCFFNICLVWFLTGLWHGASWNFVVWGLIFAFFLIVEKQFLLKWLEKAKVWNHLYVLFVVLMAFVIFQASDMKEAIVYIRSMFGMEHIPLSSPEFLYYLKSYGITLVIATIGATPLGRYVIVKCLEHEKTQGVMHLLEPMGIIILLFLSTAYLIDGSFQPFLYFRF